MEDRRNFLEETIGSLKAHEERTHGPTEKPVGQLLMTEEEWNKCETSDGQQLLLTRVEWLKRTNKGGAEGSQFVRNNRGGGYTGGDRFTRDKSCVRCFICHGYGHYATEYKKPKREKKPKSEANLVQVQDDEPALLFTQANESRDSKFLLNEGDVVPKLNKGAKTKMNSNM